MSEFYLVVWPIRCCLTHFAAILYTLWISKLLFTNYPCISLSHYRTIWNFLWKILLCIDSESTFFFSKKNPSVKYRFFFFSLNSRHYFKIFILCLINLFSTWQKILIHIYVTFDFVGVLMRIYISFNSKGKCDYGLANRMSIKWLL